MEPEGGEPTDYTAARMSKLVNHFLKKTKTNVQCDDGEAHNSALLYTKVGGMSFYTFYLWDSEA